MRFRVSRTSDYLSSTKPCEDAFEVGKDEWNEPIFCVDFNTMAGDTKTTLFQWGDLIYATPTDWICEDYNGDWHLLSNEEYEIR